MAIDGALREAGCQGDFIKRRELKAPLREQLQAGRDEQGARLGLATLVNDSHGYL